MDKPRFRYNHETKEWDQLYRFSNDIAVVSQFRRPDGSFNTFTLPRQSPIADYYLSQKASI